MIKVFSFFIVMLNFAYASGEITVYKNKKIFGCFSEINNDSYTSMTMIFRRDSDLITDDYLVEGNIQKDSLLVVSKYKSSFKESFEIAPLDIESKETFDNSKDGWTPRSHDKTFFSARGNLKAFSIQDSEEQFTYAKYSEFAAPEISLICTSNKKLVKSLFLKLIDN